MLAPLEYGAESKISLDISPPALIADCGRPAGRPIADLAAAVAAALAEPLDFPPLADAVVPGDSVTIALDVGLPQAPALVAGAVDALVKAGVEPRNMTVLQSAWDAAVGPDVRASLPRALSATITFVTHNPDDRDGLGFIATSAAGEPVYVNRLLSDADVVLPIGCLRIDSSIGYHGIETGIFPTFADAATQRRFFSSSNEESSKHSRRRRDEASEAVWLLGVLMSVQVVPAGGDSVLHVLAGSSDSVARRGRELCRQAWSYSIVRPADSVVAGISGSAAAQSWENVARALASAFGAVTDGGAIALCTELETPPGAALQWLAADDDYETALRNVRRQRSPDAAAAVHLLRALDRHRVYLLSRLDGETVSDLGMTPIESPEEVARLCRRSRSCIVLANAQHAVPHLNET